MKSGTHISIISLLLLYSTCTITAQNRSITFKDSIDGAFDMSDYIIYANGFIVVPTPITEPALGGIGGALVPVYIKKRPSIRDTITGTIKRFPPDITGGLGMYTSNHSWMVAGFRSGTFTKAGISYRLMGGYGSINFSLYKDIAGEGEKEFKFHFNIIPVYLQALKQFSDQRWSSGFQYLFLKSGVRLNDGELPNFVTDKEADNNISQLGGVIQFDSRDNIFTPDKGVRLQADFFWSDKILGSDYNSWRINYSGIGYRALTKKIIGGLRFEGSNTLGTPPFYLLPSVNLRGVAGGRYQGENVFNSEAEIRLDLYRRWSAVFYGGTATAFDEWNKVFNDPVYSYGTGFRYLLARKFKLRMGVDIAKGPEQWAYYIVFGSNWLR